MNYERAASSSASVADRTVGHRPPILRCFVASTVGTKTPYSAELYIDYLNSKFLSGL